MAIPLWQVIFVAHAYSLDPERTAEHFGWPLDRAQAALSDYKAFPTEIDRAIKDNYAMTETALKQMFPQLEVLIIPVLPIDPRVAEDC